MSEHNTSSNTPRGHDELAARAQQRAEWLADRMLVSLTLSFKPELYASIERHANDACIPIEDMISVIIENYVRDQVHANEAR